MQLFHAAVELRIDPSTRVAKRWLLLSDAGGRLKYEMQFGSGPQLRLMGEHLRNIDWDLLNKADEAPGVPQRLASIELGDHELSVLAKHSV